MQEQLNEKLSLLVDDELDNTQAYALLKALQHETELQAKLRRYALISQALKSEQCSLASPDFADKIHQKLKQEPIYFLPRKKTHDNFKKSALAVAASAVLAVVWFSANQLQHPVQPYADVNAIAQRSVQAEQMNARFKEYLQAHDNVWYVNDNVGNSSYARLASYQQK